MPVNASNQAAVDVASACSMDLFQAIGLVQEVDAISFPVVCGTIAIVDLGSGRYGQDIGAQSQVWVFLAHALLDLRDLAVQPYLPVFPFAESAQSLRVEKQHMLHCPMPQPGNEIGVVAEIFEETTRPGFASDCG